MNLIHRIRIRRHEREVAEIIANYRFVLPGAERCHSVRACRGATFTFANGERWTFEALVQRRLAKTAMG